MIDVCLYTVLASSTAVLDRPRARKLGRISIGLSVAGIIISLITVVVVLSMIATS